MTEAITLTRTLAELENPVGLKLTPEGFVKEALAIARLTPAELAGARKMLEEDVGGDPLGATATARTLRRALAFVHRAVREIRRHYSRPPADLRRLSFMDADGTAGDEGNILGLKSLFGLFALAAVLAAERFPQDFGRIADWDAWEQQVRDTKGKRDTLLRRIEAEAPTAELQFTPVGGDLGAKGFVRAGYAITGSAVVPGPGSGEQLVAWLLHNNVEVA